MRTLLRTCKLAVAAAAVLAVTGCVSQEKYDEAMMALRTANKDRAQLQADLQDERAKNTVLQDRVDSLKRELDGKDAQVAQLQGENQRLQTAFDDLKRMHEELIKKSGPQKPIIIRALPQEVDKALQELAQKYPNLIEYDPKTGTLRWKGDLLFELGKAIVRDSAKQALAEFARIAALPAAQPYDVLVVGHTDNLPVVRAETKELHPTNWHLSVHRAIAVNKVLEDSGIGPKRLGVMGYGEYRPRASNDDEAGRAQNRRVEIFLVKSASVVPTASSGIMRTEEGDQVFARPEAITK